MFQNCSRQLGQNALIFKSAASNALCDDNHLDNCGSKPLKTDANILNYTALGIHKLTFKYESPKNMSSLAIKVPFRHVLVNFLSSIYVENFILRKSFLYRSMIHDMIAKFRASSSPRFTAKDSCVAVHIRRGDRTVLYGDYRMNEELSDKFVLEYCKNATNPNENPKKCVLKPGGPLVSGRQCESWDKGCGTYPFQLIKLEDVVTRTPSLVGPHIKNMVIATDDPSWLNYQIQVMKTKHPDWNIYSLPDPSQSAQAKPVYDANGDEVLLENEPYRGYLKMRTKMGTQSGVFMFASLQLMRQCSGLFAHFDSQFAEYVLQQMCVQHANKKYVCPPTFDFRLLKSF